MSYVTGRESKHLLGPAVKEQYWWLVSCASECRNHGPWQVCGPDREIFHCVACGQKMEVVRA